VHWADWLATFDDVVRVGVYLLNMAGRPAVNMVRRRYFADARPAATAVEVSALAIPDALGREP
jgi:2-iminobutanoate/2-iminopropanoate deaminase